MMISKSGISRVAMINRRRAAALAVLIVASASVMDLAMGATATRISPYRNETIIEYDRTERDRNAIWPLYSNLCVYKTAMNNQDMHRCGVFLDIGLDPTAAGNRLDPRGNRSADERSVVVRTVGRRMRN